MNKLFVTLLLLNRISLHYFLTYFLKINNFLIKINQKLLLTSLWFPQFKILSQQSDHFYGIGHIDGTDFLPLDDQTFQCLDKNSKKNGWNISKYLLFFYFIVNKIDFKKEKNVSLASSPIHSECLDTVRFFVALTHFIPCSNNF